MTSIAKGGKTYITLPLLVFLMTCFSFGLLNIRLEPSHLIHPPAYHFILNICRLAAADEVSGFLLDLLIPPLPSFHPLIPPLHRQIRLTWHPTSLGSENCTEQTPIQIFSGAAIK
jgi:hypothetical protein